MNYWMTVNMYIIKQISELLKLKIGQFDKT